MLFAIIKSLHIKDLVMPGLCRFVHQKYLQAEQFTLLAPQLWNELLVTRRTADSLPSFY